MIRRLLAAVVLVLTLAAPASAHMSRTTKPSAISSSADITDPDQLVRFTSGALNTYWNWWFRQRLNRVYYRPAGIYWYTTVIQTRCGPTLLNNAFYCAAGNTIWLDKNLFVYYLQGVHEDFAAAAVLAHEWGHWVQDQLGWIAYATRNRFWIGKELQADCYAGMFTRYLNGYGFLEPGDLEEGGRLMVRIGDDPRTRRDSETAHGTPRERYEWFMYGYQTGNLFSCNRVYKQIYG
jgi:predicted metalloprotease